MKIKTTTKKILGIVALCCSLVLSNPAKAFIWPCIDITQISSFVNSITTGISTITNAKSQLDNVMNTIKAIGDQIATMKKYMTDLRNTITKIKESIEEAVETVKGAIDEMTGIIEDVKGKVEGYLNNEKDNASSTVNNVNQSAMGGYDSSDIQEIIKAARQASEANRDAINAIYDEALDNINETLDNANTSIDMIVGAVNTNQDLSEEAKNKLNQSANDLKNDINKLKETANSAINQAKENIDTQYAESISDAYSQYSKAIDDYALGKISIEQLKAAGETFKDTINSLDSGMSQNLIDSFSAQVDAVVEKIDNLKEEMLDSISNSKEYSDEDEPEQNDTSSFKSNPSVDEKITVPLKRPVNLTQGDKYSFNFASKKNNVFSVAVYNEQSEGSPFLISKEFMCNNKDKDDLKKLNNPNWLRVCVSEAKKEQKSQDDLYKPYLQDGVYKHILQDYSSANIVTISRAKQFASSFRGDDNENQSEIKSLEEMISKGDVDNTLSGLAALASIELWSPRFWSMIRQVDAVFRAKDMVNIFSVENDIYIDTRDENNEEVKDALNYNGGVIEADNQKVFPNVMLYHCHDQKIVSGIKAEDISIKKGEQLTDQEEKLKECLYMYASGASRGYIKGQSKEEASDATKKEWKDRQRMALQDAAFENLVLATIANYNSTEDYIPVSSLDNGKINIVSLQDGIRQISQARDAYAAGAQINYYGTQQMLNMVDTDALNLQTQILRDLQTFDFSYFPEESE